MPVEDQHVLLEAAGREAVDRGQAADRLGRDRRHRHQRQRDDQQGAEDDDATNPRAVLPLAQQPKPPMEDVAGASPARHQVAASELRLSFPDITKNDSRNVGKCVEIEIKVEYKRRPSPAGGGGKPLAYSESVRPVRTLARPMLAGIFIAGGTDQLAQSRPPGHAGQALLPTITASQRRAP